MPAKKKTSKRSVPGMSGLLCISVSALLLLTVICLNTADTVKPLAMVLMILTLLAGVMMLRTVQQQMNGMLL